MQSVRAKVVERSEALPAGTLENVRSPGGTRPGDFRPWSKNILTRSPLEVKASDRSLDPEGGAKILPFKSKRRKPNSIQIKLEMRSVTGGVAVLERVNLDPVRYKTNDLSYSNKNQSVPWKTSIVVNLKEPFFKITMRMNFAGAKVRDAVRAVKFFRAVAKGGTLKITSTGNLPLAEQRFAPNKDIEPDPTIAELLDNLLIIESKTTARFTIPSRDLPPEEAETVANTARILETGYAEYKADHITISNNSPRLAADVLKTFSSGEPRSLIFQSKDDALVNIFGADINLGPVVLSCEQTTIAEEELRALRVAVENEFWDSSTDIRFRPVGDSPVTATYPNWLSEGDAEKLLNKLSERRSGTLETTEDEEGAAGSPPDLPDMNVQAAVALLRSWYEEDPQEQRDTLDKLKEILEENRTSDRALFQ